MNNTYILQKPNEDMLLPLQTIARLYMISHKICSLIQEIYYANDNTQMIQSHYIMLDELIDDFEYSIMCLSDKGSIIISSRQFLNKARRLREKLKDYTQSPHSEKTFKELVDIIQM